MPAHPSAGQRPPEHLAIKKNVTKFVAFAARELMGNTAYTDTGSTPTVDCSEHVYYVSTAKLFHCLLQVKNYPI
jgi:hypothetical protein